MKLVRIMGGSRGRYIVLATGVAIVSTIGLLGCLPQDVLPGGNVSANGNTAPTILIKAPTLDVNVRAGELVTVNYEVEDPDGDAATLSISYDLDGQADTNDEVLIATGLPLGSKAYQINTTTIPSGRYWIQLDAQDSRGGRTVRYAQGAMNVSGIRTFAFQEPLVDVRATNGESISIRFTSSELVNYTLFYDQDGIENGNETNIVSGSGQNVTQTWLLANIPPGTYYVGAKIRDGLGETETNYAPGRVIMDGPPSVVVTAPQQDVQVWAGEQVSVEYQVVDEDGEARSTIFIDVDRVPNNGNETTIVSGLPEESGPSLFLLDTTSISPGGYFVGVSATDNLNDDVVAYAPGRVEVFSTELTIVFLEPAADVSVIEGSAVNVSWQVTAPSGGGTMSVLYVKLDGLGDPVGEEMLISQGPIAPDATLFDTTVLDVEPGAFYRLLIRVTPTFGTPPDPVFGPKIHVKSAPNIVLKEPRSSVTVGTTDRLYIEWQVSNLDGPPSQVSADILLDEDTLPESGNELGLTPVDTRVDPVNNIYTFSTTWDVMANPVSPGTYYLYLAVNDGGNIIADYGSAETDTVFLANGTGAETITITVKPRITGTFWMGDAGKDADADGVPESIVFAGFDFYDSAGSYLASLSDFDGDGLADFLIVAQYAKPFRAAPVGDAYVIYGDSNRYAGPLAISNVSIDPNIAVLNLNSVGTTIRGALFIGPSQVTSPSAPSSGIQSAMFMPDLTGDGVGELAFGIPHIDNSYSLYASTAGHLTLTNVTKAGQMRRGTVIIATSQNDINQNSLLPLERIIHLDRIGQHYDPGTLQDPSAQERRVTDLIPGDEASPSVHHIELLLPDGAPFPPGTWGHPPGIDAADNDICGPRPIPPLNRPPLSYAEDADNRYVWDVEYNPLLVDNNNDGDFDDGIPLDHCRFTGFLNGEQWIDFGSRILGDAPEDMFGTTIEWWRGALVATAPDADYGTRTEAGIVYVRNMRSRVGGVLSVPWAGPVKPNNLVMWQNGPYDHPTLGATGIIYGAQANARLSTAASLGSPARSINPIDRQGGDFNGDGLEDLALGAPGTNGGAGAGYVFYVRMPEPYYFDLAQLSSGSTDPTRRVGVQINGESGDGFGEVKPSGLDFNGDGFADALFGNPNADSQAGQAILVFGGPSVASPSGGWSIDDVAYGPGLNATNYDPNLALGIVFKGAPGDMAGAAVAGIGDFDGDGLEDLVIAAPHGSPRFEAGGAVKQGIDRDGDGEPDDVDGDGNPDPLIGAGLVYLVYGQRNSGPGGSVRPLTDPPVIDLSKVGTAEVPGAVFVGKAPGDELGGGMTTPDGIAAGTRAIGFAPAGDVDGDGLNDILISSVRASPLDVRFAGEVYLIFGVQPPTE